MSLRRPSRGATTRPGDGPAAWCPAPPRWPYGCTRSHARPPSRRPRNARAASGVVAREAPAPPEPPSGRRRGSPVSPSPDMLAPGGGLSDGPHVSDAGTGRIEARGGGRGRIEGARTPAGDSVAGDPALRDAAGAPAV